MAWARVGYSVTASDGSPITPAATSTVPIPGTEIQGVADDVLGFAIESAPVRTGKKAAEAQQAERGPEAGKPQLLNCAADLEAPADETSGVAAGRRLRMFHVLTDQIEQVVSTFGKSIAGNRSFTSVEAGYGIDDHIAYIESDAMGVFEIRPSYDIQYWYTFVPSAKVVTDWSVEVISDYSFTQLPARSEAFPAAYGVLITTTMETDSFVVLYKDPHVFAVPEALGGGWMMLLGRVRVRRSVADAYLVAHPEFIEALTRWETVDRAAITAAQQIEGPQHGDVISDIVAFHCPEQTFRDVRATGPYLVVDSLTGINPSGAPSFRTWLGAPTGAFVQDDEGNYVLFVLYNAEQAVSPDGATFDGNEDLADAYHATGFEGGIGVKRIEGAIVQTALATGAPREDSWSRASEWPGDIQNTIRIWMSTEDGLAVDRTLTEAIREAIAEQSPELEIDTSLVEPDSSDPAAMEVDGRLMLFLSINNTNGDNGFVQEIYEDESTLYGLWRFVAVPERTPLPGSAIVVFGRDFVAYHGTYLAPSPNLLVTSYRLDGSNHQAQDADPVPRASGPWFPSGLDLLFARPEWNVDLGGGALQTYFESERYTGTIDDSLLLLR